MNSSGGGWGGVEGVEGGGVEGWGVEGWMGGGGVEGWRGSGGVELFNSTRSLYLDLENVLN